MMLSPDQAADSDHPSSAHSDPESLGGADAKVLGSVSDLEPVEEADGKGGSRAALYPHPPQLSREEKRRRRRATAKYRSAHATRERIRVEAFNLAFVRSGSRLNLEGDTQSPSGGEQGPGSIPRVRAVSKAGKGSCEGPD